MLDGGIESYSGATSEPCVASRFVSLRLALVSQVCEISAGRVGHMIDEPDTGGQKSR